MALSFSTVFFFFKFLFFIFITLGHLCTSLGTLGVAAFHPQDGSYPDGPARCAVYPVSVTPTCRANFKVRPVLFFHVSPHPPHLPGQYSINLEQLDGTVNREFLGHVTSFLATAAQMKDAKILACLWAPFLMLRASQGRERLALTVITPEKFFLIDCDPVKRDIGGSFTFSFFVILLFLSYPLPSA